MKRIIVTADDFGLDVAVNEAVERAHRQGILSTTSLMVGEAAVADAVARARAMPGLHVGLHLVLADGRPVLAPEHIPDLVDQSGRFPADMLRSGFKYFFRASVRRQLADEIRAQFEAFAATGLVLDHVNGHKHVQLHPTVASLIMDIGRPFDLRALRIPAEPPIAGLRRGLGGVAMALWSRQLRHRARRAGLAVNDHLVGLAWSGAMSEERVLAVLPRLPEGITELYFHPAARRTPRLVDLMPTYRHEQELAALTSSLTRAAITHAGLVETSFGALSRGIP